jgi:hypothetical protein
MTDDQFQMLYCDTATCRVNTFERGDGSEGAYRQHDAGRCPGCNTPGRPVDQLPPTIY